MSSETRSFEPLTPLLDNINDFMMTVLSPLPESSSLISSWNKFRPLLSSNNSNPARIQNFLTELEPRGSSSRNTFLSGKSLVDLDIETLRKYLQQKQAVANRGVKLRIIPEEQDSLSTQNNNALQRLKTDMSTQGDVEEERRLQKVYSTPQLLIRNDSQKDTSFYYDMNQSFSSRSGEARTAVAAAQEVFIVPISSYQHCPSALEFVAKVMNKPISQVTNYEFYESFYVFEGKNSRFSFYHCLVLSHFLHSFAHKTTSLWLSSLFEKIVFHKNQFSLYPNKEKLYESLTSGLKSLIQEKIARPSSTQELFLNMFFGDSYFREGLVIVLKEFVIGHVQDLDYCEYTSKFHGSFGHVGQFISTFRKAHLEPTHGIYELFSKVLDGCIDIHSVGDGRIEAKLYNSEGFRFKEQKVRLVSVESQGMKGKGYHVMIQKEQAELISRIYSGQNLKGTVYYSMESGSEGEEDLKSRVEKTKDWIFKGFPMGENDKPKVKKAATFNRDLLLQKARQITNKMSDHSNELKGVVDNLRRQKKSDDDDGLTPRNRPVIKYTSPFSPSIKIPGSGGFKTPTAKTYETPFANTKNNNYTNLNATFSSEKCKPAFENLYPRLNVLPPIEERPRNNIPPPPKRNAAPRNNLLERLFNNTLPLDRDYLKPTIPITTTQRLFADGGVKGYKEDLRMMKNSNSSLSSRISLPKLPGYESAEQSFDYSQQFENSFLDNKVMNTTFVEDNKENKNVNILNMRSPLKKIKVYGHQRDTLVANVDREANYLQEIIQKSPHNSPNIRRFILENNAY